jgi:penicillin-binding protein 1A
MQRLAELKKTDPAAAAAELGENGKATASLMSPPAREALKRITSAMRKAAGIAEPPPTAPGAAPAPTPIGVRPTEPQALPPGGRADARDADGRTRSAETTTSSVPTTGGGHDAASSAIP